MKTIFCFLRLTWYDCKIKLARAMSYRFDFISGLIMSFCFSFIAPLFQLFIYSKTNGYPGWNLNEILLFQAVLLLWLGVTETFFADVKRTSGLIIQFGNFDRLLLIPYPSIIVLLSKGFTWTSLGTLLAGCISLILTIRLNDLSLSVIQILLFAITLFGGIILHVSLLIIYCSILLRLIYVERLREIFDRITFFSSFPAEVYSHIVKFFYLTIIPVGLWVWFPAKILLGHIDLLVIWGLFATCIIFVLSVLFWKFQLKNYSSAGG